MKTAGKVAIAIGGVLAIGGIAYAVSPRFRDVVGGIGGGSAVLTPHQKLQVEINKIIANKTFFTPAFFELCYNQGDAGAQAAIFRIAKDKLKFEGETWEDFTYEGLAMINENFRTHWHMQYQITRILQSDDFADYRAQLRAHYRNDNNFSSTAEILQGIYQNALDDTHLSNSLAGSFNEYYYHPVEGVDPFWDGGDTSFTQPTEVAWFEKYFTGLKGGATYHGGGKGDTGGGGSGGSGGGSGTGIDINGNAVVGWVHDTWCKIFPDLCATPDPTDCGYCSIYDAENNQCIPDPACDPGNVNYDPCNGMGVYNEVTGQCEMINECPVGWHDEGGICWPDEEGEGEECPEGFFDFGDGRGCVEW